MPTHLHRQASLVLVVVLAGLAMPSAPPAGSIHASDQSHRESSVPGEDRITRDTALTLESRIDVVRSSVIDPGAGYIYYGSYSDFYNPTPAQIVRVRTADLARLETLTLQAGEGNLASAVIDTAGGFAYFGTRQNYVSCKIIKVRLSDFTRVGAITLADNEGNMTAAVIDPLGGYAYFGNGYQHDGRVIRIRLSDFTEAGSLSLGTGPDYVASAVIDPAGGYAYFGTTTASFPEAPGIVVKVRLSDFSVAGSLTLPADEVQLTAAAIDPAAGYAYFGTGNVPAHIVKVRLSDLARVDSLDVGGNRVGAAVLDAANGYAYFSRWDEYSSTSALLKIRLADFTLQANPPLGSFSVSIAQFDPAGFAYFGTAKVRLSDLAIVGSPNLTGENNVVSAVIDREAGFAYLGLGLATPAQIVKIDLSDFSHAAAISFPNGESDFESAAIDPAGGYAYFGTGNEYPGRIVRVRLSDFTHQGSLTLAASEGHLCVAVIDPAAGFAYFGTRTNPARIIKVRLSDFARVDAITLNSGEKYLQSAVIDPGGGYAYFGSDGGSSTVPDRVFRIQLSDFTRSGTLVLNSGEYGLTSAVIDPLDGYAYFGTDRGRVVRIRLSDFSRVDAVSLAQDESYLTSAVIDPLQGYAYFGTDTEPAHVVEVRLSDFTRTDGVTLPGGEIGLTAGFIDPGAGLVYFGTDTSPGIVVRLSNGADLALTGLVTPDPAPLGSLLAYMLAVTNNGPSNAVHVVLTDSLPTGVTFLSAPAGCTQTAGAVICLLGTLASGSTVTTTIVVSVDPTAAGALVNVAETRSDLPDPELANNSVVFTTLTFSVCCRAQLPIWLNHQDGDRPGSTR